MGSKFGEAFLRVTYYFITRTLKEEYSEPHKTIQKMTPHKAASRFLPPSALQELIKILIVYRFYLEPIQKIWIWNKGASSSPPPATLQKDTLPKAKLGPKHSFNSFRLRTIIVFFIFFNFFTSSFLQQVLATRFSFHSLIMAWNHQIIKYPFFDTRFVKSILHSCELCHHFL